MAYRKIPKGYKKERVEEFLLELSELAKKYGIAIHGCGHCGSPSLPHGFGYDNLRIDEETCLYKVGDKACVWI